MFFDTRESRKLKQFYFLRIVNSDLNSSITRNITRLLSCCKHGSFLNENYDTNGYFFAIYKPFVMSDARRMHSKITRSLLMFCGLSFYPERVVLMDLEWSLSKAKY